MTDDSELLQQIAINTRAIAQLLAVSLPKGFTAKVEATLNSPEKRLAYSLSNGERSAREVARLAEISHPSVGRWWEEWYARGLVESTPSRRMRAIFDIALLVLAERLEDSG